MPDEPTLSEIERILKDREQETLEALTSIEASTVAAEFDGSIGRLTRMDAHHQQQVALHGKRRLEFQLKCIQGALIRLKDGSYGACIRCEEAIAPARLEGTPEAPYCVTCQGSVENEFA